MGRYKEGETAKGRVKSATMDQAPDDSAKGGTEEGSFISFFSFLEKLNLDIFTVQGEEEENGKECSPGNQSSRYKGVYFENDGAQIIDECLFLRATS
jgi:hypothetical protein